MAKWKRTTIPLTPPLVLSLLRNLSLSIKFEEEKKCVREIGRQREKGDRKVERRAIGKQRGGRQESREKRRAIGKQREEEGDEVYCLFFFCLGNRGNLIQKSTRENGIYSIGEGGRDRMYVYRVFHNGTSKLKSQYPEAKWIKKCTINIGSISSFPRHKVVYVGEKKVFFFYIT